MDFEMNDLDCYDKSMVLETVNDGNLEQFSGLLKQLGAHGYRDWPDAVGELKDALRQEHFFDHHRLQMLRKHDEMIGYFWVKPELNIDRAIIGACGEHYRFLLETALNFACALPITTCVSALRSHEKQAKHITETLGFETGKVYHIMQCIDPVTIQDIALPTGYSMRYLSGPEEANKLCAIQNSVFASHYGYEPNTPKSIQQQLAQPGAGCENVLLIINDTHQKIVSYCWSVIRHTGHQPSGKISMLGVLPEYRGKDLGRIIASAAITDLQRRGIHDFQLEVDGDNLSAIKIYNPLGFKIVDHIEWMTKALHS